MTAQKFNIKIIFLSKQSLIISASQHTAVLDLFFIYGEGVSVRKRYNRTARAPFALCLFVVFIHCTYSNIVKYCNGSVYNTRKSFKKGERKKKKIICL